MTWRQAVVDDVRAETASSARLRLDVEGWSGHVPGQHVDVRLTAADGYTATRSYSIASAPERPGVDLLVQAVVEGEVSGFLTASVARGDTLEVRGPVGGHFVWSAGLGGPVQMIAGGSGVVPFLSMMEHHELSGSEVQMRLLYAVRGPQHALGAGLLREVGPRVSVTYAYSRTHPPGWAGITGRLSRSALVPNVIGPSCSPQIFVCGPTPFVEDIAADLVASDHPPATIKTERFGVAT